MSNNQRVTFVLIVKSLSYEIKIANTFKVIQQHLCTKPCYNSKSNPFHIKQQPIFKLGFCVHRVQVSASETVIFLNYMVLYLDWYLKKRSYKLIAISRNNLDYSCIRVSVHVIINSVINCGSNY